jgi:hypothetical protein
MRSRSVPALTALFVRSFFSFAFYVRSVERARSLLGVSIAGLACDGEPDRAKMAPLRLGVQVRRRERGAGSQLGLGVR